MVQQIETMGAPFSQGGAGQGTRLLLGGVTAPYQALIPTDTDDYNNQTLKPAATEARWLFPASLTEFDVRCGSNDVNEAQSQNCSLVGTFNSCATGCSFDPLQEANWDSLPKSILGFDRSSWDIATGEQWQDLRGMLAGFRYFNNETGGADTFVLMETSPSSAYIEPFANLSTRAFWIVNQTANVSLRDIVVDNLPIYNSYKLKGWKCDSYDASPVKDMNERMKVQPGADMFGVARGM